MPTVLHSIRTEESNLLTTAELSQQTESQSERTDRLLDQHQLLLKILLLLLASNIQHVLFMNVCEACKQHQSECFSCSGSAGVDPIHLNQ